MSRTVELLLTFLKSERPTFETVKEDKSKQRQSYAMARATSSNVSLFSTRTASIAKLMDPFQPGG
jgi:hypothetical protein